MMRIPKHVMEAANALLAQFQLNTRILTEKELEKLPESINTTVKNLLLPYGWAPVSETAGSDMIRYLSVSAAERYTSVSKWSLMRAAGRNELKFIKLGKARSSKVLFDREEIDMWLRSRNVSANRATR